MGKRNAGGVQAVAESAEEFCEAAGVYLVTDYGIRELREWIDSLGRDRRVCVCLVVHIREWISGLMD